MTSDVGVLVKGDAEKRVSANSEKLIVIDNIHAYTKKCPFVLREVFGVKEKKK